MYKQHTKNYPPQPSHLHVDHVRVELGDQHLERRARRRVAWAAGGGANLLNSK
jgi:hypothetical protein